MEFRRERAKYFGISRLRNSGISRNLVIFGNLKVGKLENLKTTRTGWISLRKGVLRFTNNAAGYF